MATWHFPFGMVEITEIPPEAAEEILARCVVLAAQRAARRLTRQLDRALAPSGLTSGQFSIMVALRAMGAPRLSDLSQVLAMDQTTVTAGLKALDRRGLTSRGLDPEDRRARRVRLTAAGSALVAKAVPLWQAEMTAFEAAYGARETAELTKTLDNLQGRKPGK